MNNAPSTAREALLAELLGDMQALIARVAQVDQTARSTADAIAQATEGYRSQVDEMVGKLRAETASIMLKATEHAANSLVGQQQATLHKAALQGMRQAATETAQRKTTRDWVLAAGVGAVSGLVFAGSVIWVYAAQVGV